MTTATLPADEVERLATLHALNILDTPPEERFDRITRLALRVFDVPIAVVTLVDADRVWFKSCFGLGASETPREISFCPHAILSDDTFVVPDTRLDPCFAANPFVTQAPFLYFYAGQPLRAANGHKVGILCLLDTKPRSFGEADRQALRDMAALVETELNATHLSQALLRQVGELRRANQQLMDADRHKDEFLSVISHELRTPLNFITGFASTLDDEVQGPLNAAQHEATGKILVGSERMLRLVDDLLDLARIQAGQLVLVPTPTDIQSLIEDAMTSLAPLASPRVRLDAEVTAVTAPCIDGARVTQVLTNLVGNALKFTNEGLVHVRAALEGGRLRVEVADTGEGIAAEDLGRLFGRFRQLDMGDTRKAGGTGLGLAISKALVEAHGGEIGVHSAGRGHGATFWFTLPITPAEGELPAVTVLPAEAPLPSDEPARLAALKSLGILDTPPEERFDRITRLAASRFGVTAAAIVLVDAERQWTKSCYGVSSTEMPREISFCAHAILDEGPLVVTDATRDPRFAGNPLVLGEPGIRFYAGHPIVGPSGLRLGTLCLVGYAPRILDAQERQELADYARLVERELAASAEERSS